MAQLDPKDTSMATHKPCLIKQELELDLQSFHIEVAQLQLVAHIHIENSNLWGFRTSHIEVLADNDLDRSCFDFAS